MTGTRKRAQKASPEKPIGIFDSGIGGLTVLKEIKKILPRESFMYVADTAHVPYGGKKPEQIKSYALSICRYLERRGVKMIVMGCNFSSSVALRDAQEKCRVPVLGLIDGAARKALQTTKNKKIGILATAGTVKASAYQKAFKHLSPQVKFYARGCPDFVPLVESGILNGDRTHAAAQKYLHGILKNNVDTVVLGCTHYPLLLPVLKEIAGKKITFVDPASAISKKVKAVLTRENLLNDSTRVKPHDEFIATGSDASLKNYGSLFLGYPIPRVKPGTGS